MSSKKRAKGGLSYDRRAKRFRDAKGRFIPLSRGLKSAFARKQYYKAPKKARYVPKPAPPPKPLAPVKKKAKKKVKRKVKPAPMPAITEVPEAPGQFIISNASHFNLDQLAALILSNIKAGAFSFRFWYRLPDGISINYPTGVGSTQPLHKSRITRNDRLSEVKGFLRGRGGRIKGKVTVYWYSRRHAVVHPLGKDVP